MELLLILSLKVLDLDEDKLEFGKVAALVLKPGGVKLLGFMFVAADFILVTGSLEDNDDDDDVEESCLPRVGDFS